MPCRHLFSVLTVMSLLAHAPIAPAQPGPHRLGPRSNPDLELMKDWPKPELRAGLSEAQIGAAIEAYAQQLHDADHFSGVVLAVKAGKVIATRAYGLASTTTKLPNMLETRFNIGSITKLFTKIAIAQLADAGVLSLDDTVRRHLPELAIPAADKITIRQLVDHKSGLGDIFGPKYDAAPPSRLRELADFVPLFVDQPLAFEPGSSERYSNAGYVVLGLIVERLTSSSYRDYVRQHIFAPAGMASTGLWAVDERVADLATGYTRRGPNGELSARIPNTDTLPGRPSSAGGAFSTAADLRRFWDALSANKLLPPAWTAWMLNRPPGNPGRSPRLGFGGGAPGVNAAMEIDGVWTVIVVANFDPPAAFAVARGAMDIIRGAPATDRAP